MFATSNLGDRKNEKPEKDSTKANSGPGGESDQVRSWGHDDVKEDDGRTVGLVKEEAFNRELNAGGSLLDEGAISVPVERCEDSTAPDIQSTGELGISNFFSKINLAFFPEELVLYVYEFLQPVDILSISQSCQLWRKMGENNKLWEKKCKEAGLTNRLNSADRKGLELRKEISQIEYSAWKLNFRKKYIVTKKFRNGVFQELAVDLTHGDLLYVETFNDGQIFNDKLVYYKNKNLYVYSLLNGELLHRLVGHTGTVTTSDMNESYVFSGSWDRSVKVWDVHTGFCLHTLHGHTGRVKCLAIHGNIAVSGSWDRTLRMWDLGEGSCLRVLTAGWWVGSVQYDGKLVVSADTYREIKVWDAATGRCLHTHQGGIIVAFNGVQVLERVGNKIGVWQADTGVRLNTLTYGIDKMKLHGDLLAVLLYNGSVQIRRVTTLVLLHTFATEKDDKYRSMDINDRFVVTGSERGTVKLWDIKTGQLIRVLVKVKGRLDMMWITDNRIVCQMFQRVGPIRVIRHRLHVLNFDTNNEDYDMGNAV